MDRECAREWDSDGNGNEKHIFTGIGMAIISVGLGMSKNIIWLKNAHSYQILSADKCFS